MIRKLHLLLLGHLSGALIVAIGLGIYWQFFHHMPPAQSANSVAALKHQATETVTVTSIQAFPTADKRKLDLPEDIQKDSNAYVVAAIQLNPNTHPQTITAVMGTQTGQTALYTQQTPLPWIAPIRDTTLNIDYGFKRTTPIWRIAAHKELLQIKDLQFGVTGQVDTDGTWFTGVGASLKW